MLRNYFLVALRNLNRYRFFSAINVFGLAMSMSVCLGIIMLVADQLQYDRHNSKRDKIFRVNTRYLTSEGLPAGNDYSTTPLAMGPALSEEFTGIKNTVRIKRGFGNGWIEFERDLSIPIAGFFADPGFLDLFESDLKYGDPSTALNDPYSVVLTEAAAAKLFDVENPVGQEIKVGKLGTYKVTGVIRQKSAKSHIVFEGLASYSTIPSLIAQGSMEKSVGEWTDFTSGWVYILLDENVLPTAVQAHLDKLSKSHKPNPHMGTEERSYQFFLQNLCSITPGPLINNPIGPFMPRMFVYFFGGLALIVMLTSCFNYTSLSVARALSRAKEIGVRKVTGATRLQIFVQFICEAVVLSLVALGFALILLILIKPFLLNLRFAQVLKWDLETNYMVYAVFILFAIIVGLFAGIFPAAVLSRFEPIKVLKRASSIRLFSRLTLRKALLIGQFAISFVFIVSVLLLKNQLDLFMHANHGFEMKDKFSIRLNSTAAEPLKEALARQSNIINSSAVSHIPATGITYGEGFRTEKGGSDFINLDYFNVDADYLENMSINLIAGSNFDPATATTNKILINRKAAEKLNFLSPHDAVGKQIFSADDSSTYEVLGVVEDYNHQMLIDEIGPMALKYRVDNASILQVKFAGSPLEASKTIERVWKELYPHQKIEYKDFEQEVKGFYQTVFSDFVSIVGIISVLAIVVSCLGLLGMATYSTEVRMKEISIRKVLGSSESSLVYLLTKGSLLILAIAILFALPIAWFVNNLWLEHIVYRTSLDMSVVAQATIVLMGLGLITVGSQTFRAAASDPVKSLKND
jgi:putative ABC transport system permease protein